MKKYVCTVCGYVYDEVAGIPESGIAPGTKWEDIPEDWTCPLCGATKSEFKEQIVEDNPTEKNTNVKEDQEELREMSFGEISALCSNLSKGCEKQYLSEEAGLFGQLAEYYNSKSESVQTNDFQELAELILKDIDRYAAAKSISAAHTDRGALRALVWGEKVTRILSSLLNRYEKQKDSLIEATNIYVCEICGFVYIGNEPPNICPVCKVPNIKIKKIEREAV